MGHKDILRGLANDAKAEGEPQRFSEDRTRLIVRGLLGWTCYRGLVMDGNFHGTKQGVAADLEQAERWLAGGEVGLDLTPGSEGFKL